MLKVKEKYENIGLRGMGLIDKDQTVRHHIHVACSKRSDSGERCEVKKTNTAPHHYLNALNRLATPTRWP